MAYILDDNGKGNSVSGVNAAQICINRGCKVSLSSFCYCSSTNGSDSTSIVPGSNICIVCVNHPFGDLQNRLFEYDLDNSVGLRILQCGTGLIGGHLISQVHPIGKGVI